MTSALQCHYPGTQIQGLKSMDLLSKLSLDTPDGNREVLELISARGKKNHRPKLYKSLVICANHVEALSKGSVFQMLPCKHSQKPQSCQLQLLLLKLGTICIWNEHSVHSYLHPHHAKTRQTQSPKCKWILPAWVKTQHTDTQHTDKNIFLQRCALSQIQPVYFALIISIELTINMVTKLMSTQ